MTVTLNPQDIQPLEPNSPVKPSQILPIPYVWESFSLESQTDIAARTFRRQLSFLAKSIRINNYSGQWLEFQGLDIFVRPRFVYLTLNFPSGFQMLDIRNRGPLGPSGSDIDAINAAVVITVFSKMQSPTGASII